MVLRARRSVYRRAESAGHLHREVTQTAGPGRDQDQVAGLDAEHGGQALFGGEPVNRHRSGVGPGKPRRYRGHLLARTGDVLGVAAGQTGVTVDRVAVAEPELVAAVTLYQPGELAAGHVRQRPAPPAAA